MTPSRVAWPDLRVAPRLPEKAFNEYREILKLDPDTAGPSRG